ncbi:MAG: 3-isopropylmalate dehydratase small subunit, partial [Halomonas sp.]
AFKNGILLITLSEEEVDRLFAGVDANEGYQLDIDLENQRVNTPGGEILEFEVDAFRKHCLLNGLDDIGITLQDEDAIRTFEQKHKDARPWLFRQPA